MIVPGDVVGDANSVTGSGVIRREHLGHSVLIATCCGHLEKKPMADSDQYLISVLPQRHFSAPVPTPGALVMGIVQRIATGKSAYVRLLSLQGHALQSFDAGGQQAFQGILRVQDIRAVDHVAGIQPLEKCVRPGDVIRARVIALGDSLACYLSTAENDLGVIYAVCSVSRRAMVPISWEQMQCPVTGITEYRKCAKPDA